MCITCIRCILCVAQAEFPTDELWEMISSIASSCSRTAINFHKCFAYKFCEFFLLLLAFYLDSDRLVRLNCVNWVSYWFLYWALCCCEVKNKLQKKKLVIIASNDECEAHVLHQTHTDTNNKGHNCNLISLHNENVCQQSTDYFLVCLSLGGGFAVNLSKYLISLQQQKYSPLLTRPCCVNLFTAA